MSTLFGSSLGEGGEYSRPTKQGVGGGNPRNAAVQQELIELSQNTVTIYSIIILLPPIMDSRQTSLRPLSFPFTHTHKDA